MRLILAKVGTLPVLFVRPLMPRPFRVKAGDRCRVAFRDGEEVSCLVNKITPSLKSGRRVYFLSRQ